MKKPSRSSKASPRDPSKASTAAARYKENLENKGVGTAESAKAALKPTRRVLESVLVYSKSAWYAHATTSATNHWFFHFGWDNGVNIDQTDDPMKFNLDDLSRYQVLVLNSTTNFGEDLTGEQRAAGARHCRRPCGGGASWRVGLVCLAGRLRFRGGLRPDAGAARG